MGTAIRQRRQARGPKGAGRITIQKSGSAKVYLGDNVIDIAAEDIPESIGNWKFTAVGTPTKPVFIQLTSDETKVMNVRPLDGNFFVRFNRLAGREGHPPTIMSMAERQPEGFQFPIRAHEEFYTILEVVNHKDYDGMEIPLTLWYMFDVDKDTEEVVINGGRSNAYNTLIKFLEVAGYDLDADTLKPGEPGEILTQLNKILQSRNRVFQCSVKNGYVPFKDALALAPEGSV